MKRTEIVCNIRRMHMLCAGYSNRSIHKNSLVVLCIVFFSLNLKCHHEVTELLIVFFLAWKQYAHVIIYSRLIIGQQIHYPLEYRQLVCVAG